MDSDATPLLMAGKKILKVKHTSEQKAAKLFKRMQSVASQKECTSTELNSVVTTVRETLDLIQELRNDRSSVKDRVKRLSTDELKKLEGFMVGSGQGGTARKIPLLAEALYGHMFESITGSVETLKRLGDLLLAEFATSYAKEFWKEHGDDDAVVDNRKFDDYVKAQITMREVGTADSLRVRTLAEQMACEMVASLQAASKTTVPMDTETDGL